MAATMKVSLAILLLAGTLGSLNGASVDRGAGSNRYPSSTTTTTSAPVTPTSTSASTTTSGQSANSSRNVPDMPAGAPVWNPASGQFVMDNAIPTGGAKERYEKPKDKLEAHKPNKDKYEAEKPKDKNEAKKPEESHSGWFGGRFLKPAGKPAHPPGCPPCPCLPQPTQLPGVKPVYHDDVHRSRRATNDDYWHSTGPANPLLSQINMGYNARMQMQDFFGKYGFPLHIGGINQADFNYPKDFSAFEQPATAFTDIRGLIVYKLVGPLEMVKVDPLSGPSPAAVVTSGVFKLTGIQKDGIMKLVSDGGTTYLVYCNAQRIGNCLNLLPTRDIRDLSRFP